MWSNKELQNWRQALKNGAITASPAEGVYGYNVNPFNEIAVEKLLKLKQRSASKGLIILIPNVEFLPQITENLTTQETDAINKYWHPSQPATTILLSATKSLSKNLTGEHTTIAVRVPNCTYMLEYLNYWNAPLVSTSLNNSGEDPSVSTEKINNTIKSLGLKTHLSGEVSKLFNPATGEFIR